MKFGQILIIGIASLLTFFGLMIAKLYEKYVKQNILVQSALYIFWTAIIFRVLYWAVKPFINSNIFSCIVKALNVFVEVLNGLMVQLNTPVITLILILAIIVVCFVGLTKVLKD